MKERHPSRSLLAGSFLIGQLAFGFASSAHAQDAAGGASGSATPPAVQSSTTPAAAPPAGQPASPSAASSDQTSAQDGSAPGSASQAIPQAYLKGPQSVSAEQIAAFLANPASIFDGTDVPAQLSRQVRLLVGSDNRAVQAMIDLSKNPDTGAYRLGTIAVGLAEATRAAPPASVEYGAYIQEAVARSGSEELIAAYGAVLQTVEVETASLGTPGGGGSAPGSGSLGGVGAPGISNGFNGDDVVPQQESTFGVSSNGSVAYTDDGNGTGQTFLLTAPACSDPSPVSPCLF